LVEERPNLKYEPASIDEIRETVAREPKLHLQGEKTRHSFIPKPPKFQYASGISRLSLCNYRGIVDWESADQVVAVRAGTPIGDLQSELLSAGQCLPLAGCTEWWPAADSGTVGGAIAMNLPHILMAQCGSWRDWVLGMTLILADGTVAKCGSRAVKNVAGYDIQKLVVGSRGTLAVIADVVLRTFPVTALPAPRVTMSRPSTDPIKQARQLMGTPGWEGMYNEDAVQGVRATDLEAAFEANRPLVVCVDSAANVLYLRLAYSMFGPEASEQDRKRYSRPMVHRFPGDWLVAGYGRGDPLIANGVRAALMKRAKHIFDPTHKLNPGEMGIF
jgi:hypothetical protein